MIVQDSTYMWRRLGCRMVHGDFKAANVLHAVKNGALSIAVTDFGHCHRIKPGENKVHCNFGCGTPLYLAPETVPKEGQAYMSLGTDVWLFGIFIVEIFTSRMYVVRDHNAGRHERVVARCAYLVHVTCKDLKQPALFDLDQMLVAYSRRHHRADCTICCMTEQVRFTPQGVLASAVRSVG